jgi:pimeloyl-ACP methyl ester carboxylesterase
VARLVAGVLPRVRVEEIEGLGHMAPVTQPGEINARIERFLADI